MKWQFPRKAADKAKDIFGKAKKQASRYTLDKEGAKRLGEDVEQGLDVLGDRLDTAIEPSDPIYTEPIHRKPEEKPADLVLTRGPVDHYFLFIVIALCLFGAVIMGCGILAGELLLFVLAGFMFVIEMLSSLLQRVYYKLSHGKRIFKMAPLHHHFEKCGWSEVEIVTAFTLVSAAFCFWAFLGGLLF